MMNTRYKVVIPARYSSSRLPGKPLLDIAGKPMIQHVCERALESGADEVVVATDDSRILQCAQGYGGEALLTDPDHESGTDRLAEVATEMRWDDETIVVNLQGDEPLMDPGLLSLVAANLDSHGDAGITTLATKIKDRDDIFDPNIVKVVCDKAGYAMYFSRAPIPWVRGDFDGSGSIGMPLGVEPLRHLGIYAYRVGALKLLTALDPCEVERAESLEQLRALWNGIKIHVDVIDQAPGHGVDTAEDLERVRLLMNL